MSRFRGLGAVSLLAAAALLVGITGCGGGGGSGGSGTVIRGTTDQPVCFDPAGVYDLPSWDILFNVYQTLLTIPPGGNKPVPDAAKSCDFTNPTTYECTMKDGLKFSDGSPLTAEDVKFSFERNVEIAAPEGASSLLANMKSIEAPDPTRPSSSISRRPMRSGRPSSRPSRWRSCRPTSTRRTSSSRTTRSSARASTRWPLRARASSWCSRRTPSTAGDVSGEERSRDRPVLRQVLGAEARRRAGRRRRRLPQLQPDRPPGPEERRAASASSGARARRSATWSSTRTCSRASSDAQKLAVRRAVAHTIDRQAIADNVYDGTVKPLYSMVPQGLQFATEAFKDEYGAAPDVDAAKQSSPKPA